MTLVCGIDVETDGLDLKTSNVLEIAWAIMRVGDWRPLKMASHLILPTNFQGVPEEITQLTGIRGEDVRIYGRSAWGVMSELAADLCVMNVAYFVAHNGRAFDKPMLAQLDGSVQERHWIDTKEDVNYPAHFGSRRLMHLATEYGFLNPFPHNALSDVLTMMRVLQQQDFEMVLARSKSPSIVVRAAVTYDNRDLAKARRYAWEKIDDKVFHPKQWVKRIKEMDLEKERAEAGFPVEVIA